MTNKTKRNVSLLNSSSLFVLGTASVLLGSGPAQAFDANSLPTGGNVTGGSATIATSGNTLTVNQSSNRAIIDWRNFNIGANAQANFVQPGTSSIAVNRVNGSTDPTRIDGGLHANGQVWVLNPNGVFFGKTARVDAAGVVATTANINDKAFMAGSNKLQMTGGDSGQVVNEGHISVGEGGLAAFVAPSVRNSGTIRARLGKVTLAAGDTYTLDLAGDRLVEIGLGSTKAVVDQSGKVVNAGGVIEISAKAASQAVDAVINTSGVTDASSVRSVGGKIVLGGDIINVASTAAIKADGTSGGQITAVANKTGNYAGSYSAQGTTGDGGQIETSGHAVTVASDAKISASSAHGKAGTWLIDPVNVTITSGADNGQTTGGTVTTGTIEASLHGGTSVTITTAQSGTDDGDLTLASSVNANSTGNAGLTLTGRHLFATGGSAINIAGGALVLNVNAVNPSTNPSGSWINDAIAMVGTVSGGSTVNLGAGTYVVAPGGANYVDITKSNLTLNGDGADTIIDARNASSYGVRIIGGTDHVTLSNFTLWGVTANGGYGVKAENTTNLTINNVTSKGAYKAQFDLNGVRTATLDHLTADGTAVVPGIGGSTAGAAIAITDSQDVKLTNSHTNGGAYGGVGIYQSNKASGYTYQTKNITIDGSNTFAEANPIYMEDESATNNFGAVTINGFGYAAHNNANPADLFTYFQTSAQGAIDTLDAVGAISTGSVEGWNGTAGTNTFTVGFSTADHAMSIQSAIDAANGGAVINVLAGTYGEALNINNSIDLEGAGVGQTIIRPTALIDTHTGHKYDADVKTSVFVNGVGGVTINGFTIDGNNLGNNAVVFWNNARGTISNSEIENAMPFRGAQTGQGLAVDSSGGTSVDLVVDNVSFHDWNKNAIDIVTGNGTGATGGAVNVTVKNSHFTGEGATGANAQNGILAWEQGGGSIDLTVDNDTFTGINYTGSNAVAAGVLAYGLAGGTVTVENSTFDNSVQYYIATGGGGTHEVDAKTGNTFGGVLETSATLDQLYAIEDRLSHGTDSTGDALVRIKADNVYATASKDDLQDAIEAAATGDTVNVQAGTYNGGIVLDKAGLTLSGAGAIIDAGGSQYGINVASNAGNLGTLTIDGFTVQNWTSVGINQGMAAGPLASLHITNNTVHGPVGGATANGNGIEVSGDGSIVSGNIVLNDHLNSTDWSGSGILVVNGSNITVKDNTVDGADSGIAVTNWSNPAGMTGIIINHNTVKNADEGISIQTYEGAVGGVAGLASSGPITGLTITNNTLSNNVSGLGIWDYSDWVDYDPSHATGNKLANWSSTVSNISGNIFTNNDTQISTDFTGASLLSLLNSTNTFDRTVVNNAVGNAIYGDLQTAIDTEADHSTLTLAGTFNAGANVNKVGDTLDGQNTALIQALNNGDNGITISANDVTIKNLEIAGPAGTTAYDTYNWGSDVTRGIVVARNVTGFTITGNDIHGTRNNILIDGLGNTGSITGNTIANSKSGISIQYTDGSGIAISGNTDGGNANEWGVNLHLNGHSSDGVTFFSNSQKIAADADAATQAALLALSNANHGMTVQDQGYSNSNRTAVTVSTTGSDANQGSGLSSLATIGAGINAVVAGGTVNVKDGTYVIASGGGNYLDITKSLTLKGASEAGTIIDARNASAYGLRVQADKVSLSDFTLMGPTGAGGYGIKVEPLEQVIAATDRVNNFSIANVTETGSYKNGLDLNGVDHAAISNVTVSGTTNGTGIAITDSADVTLTGTTTTGNAWGGLALYQNNATYNQQVNNITVGDTNHFGEANGVYMEDESASQDFGTVSIAGYDHAVKATVAANDSYTWLQNGEQTAIDFAAASAPTLASVQGWTGSAGDNIFTVGTSTGGTALSIQAAVTAAASGGIINIKDGAYTLAGELDINKSLTLQGQSETGTVIGSASTGYGIYVDANDVTLSDFTFNPSAAGTYGIKVEPATTTASDRVTSFAIDHVTIAGSQKTGLDLNGVNGATIDTVTVTGTVNGNGIALTDSANVAITNTDTSGNAWGGLALYQTNNTYDQQVDNITVDARSSFAEANGIYAQDQSAANDFGSIDLSGQGLQYVAKLSTGGTDGDYTFFQKTQQGALDIASAFNGRYGINDGTVQGYGGTGVNGDNHFTVGLDSNGNALSVNAALDHSTAGGIIDVLSGTYAEVVSVTAPRTINFDGADVDGLEISASGTTLSGNLKAGSVTALGDIALGGDLSIDTTEDNGTIALANVDGAHSLTLNAGSGSVLAGGLGATTRLGAVDITAGLIGVGATNKAASFAFNGDVVLSAASTVIDTTVSSTAAGNITFAGDIFGTTDGGQSLTLAAGPGTGDKSANGDIAINNAGLSNLRLGSMTVSSDDFTALTVDLAGGFTSQLSGNQLFAADTLNAGGDVNSIAAGNIGGHIVAGGNVNLTAGGTISGDITGKTVTLNGQTVNGQVTANTLNVNAQSGTITGNFAQGNVSNGISLNGKVVGASTGDTGTGTGDTGGNTANNFPNVNAKQLVVEGFALPPGTQIGANGQLILPAGTVIGLLSPGGGTPRVIMVQSVQELGALLDQGYSAIVIDLTGHKKPVTTQVASN